MRIIEKYEKDGYFWLPENPNHKIPGTLKISDGGRIELKLMGLLDEDIAVSLDKICGRGNTNIDRVVGHVEKDGPVTLENCIDIPQITFGGISRSLVHVRKAFCGVRYEQNELVKFNSVKFSVEGLDEWLGISGINVNHSDDCKTATITYKPQKEMVYELMDGFKLHIGFSYTLPGFSPIAEAKVTQKAYIELSSIKERDFQDFEKIIREITNLLCFAIDATVTISSCVFTTLKMQEGKKDVVPVHIYYKSLPFFLNRPKLDLMRMKMLFRFSDIKNDVRFFKKWLNVCLNIQPSIDSYISAVSNRYGSLEDRFLDLAKTLETYHREIFCNKAKLPKRIQKLIKPYEDKFESDDERNKLIRKIVDTRNYFTHCDKKLENKSAKGSNLYHICQKMEDLFKLHLLRKLSCDKSKIEEILKEVKDKFEQKIQSSIEN